MTTGSCIYCGEEKPFSREHAFPKSLLQENAQGWVIRNHLCQICNSKLGKLDAVFSRKSHIAFLYDQIQREKENKSGGLHSSIYHKKACGFDPIRVFSYDPISGNPITLYELSPKNDDAIYSASILQPQIILTQYAEGQTAEETMAKNIKKFTDSNSYKDIIEKEGVFCCFGNTYVFPPKTAKRYFGKIEDFRSKFIRNIPQNRCDLRIICSPESRYWKKAMTFFNSLHGRDKESIGSGKVCEAKGFTQLIRVIPDQKAAPYIERAMAKIAFHCFLFYHRNFDGSEPIFDNIKNFIYNGDKTSGILNAEGTDPAIENIVYDSAKHQHIIRFFVRGQHIGCIMYFFTGLLAKSTSYGIVLAGNPDATKPNCSLEASIPFSVHPRSQLKRRVMPVFTLGLIQPPW